jgi:recombination protein RecT
MENEQLAKTEGSSLVKFRALLSQDVIKKKFEEALGKKAPMFVSNLTTIMSGSAELQKCEHMSVISSALMAASMDLPLTPGLGFAGIVPYWDSPSQSMKAQFQVMKKGFIQLAQRTGLFKIINVSEVFEGELKSHNKFTGEYIFDETGKKSDNIIGYVSYFRLINGFEKYYYMPIEKLDIHAKRYSKSFQKGKGKWADKEEGGYEQMCEKTVLKLNLSTYAPLSVDINMMNAIVYDQAEIRDVDAKDYDYVDNEDSHKPDSVDVIETGGGKTVVISQMQSAKSAQLTNKVSAKIPDSKFGAVSSTITEAVIVPPEASHTSQSSEPDKKEEPEIAPHRESSESMYGVKVIRDPQTNAITNMDEINAAKPKESQSEQQASQETLIPGQLTLEQMEKMDTPVLLKMVMEDMDMMEAAETIGGKNTNKKLREIIFAHQNKELDKHVAPYLKAIKEDEATKSSVSTEPPVDTTKGEIPLNKDFDQQKSTGTPIAKNQDILTADTPKAETGNKYGLTIPEFDKGEQREFSTMKTVFNLLASVTPPINNPRYLEIAGPMGLLAAFPDREAIAKFGTVKIINELLNKN